MSEVDVAVRIGIATTILLPAGVLLRNRKADGTSAALFAPLTLCLSAFLVNDTTGPSLLAGSVAGSVVRMLSGFTVVFLW